ncbi:MAG: alpha-L-rhamnosidase N-terminal domain-containing protein [Lachnospiraceae bacterium]|nr:alpha-L-rhamnosidase N-terminal domain-containing protein [Lachnospiraceae bacterium]
MLCCAITRIYMTAMGAYYLYVNGRKVSTEYLAPGFTDYNSRIQVQTYDITDYLKTGGNALGIMLGKNWGRGRYGADNQGEGLYCDCYGILAEAHILYEDGRKDFIGMPICRDFEGLLDLLAEIR